jgi:cysteine desulfurase
MIYLDHAATTPVDKEVLASMLPYFSEKFGNPSSIYEAGRDAKAVLEEARAKTAELLGATKPSEIIFTSGATESTNLAIMGTSEAAANILMGRPHIITSSIEHHCVLDTVKHLEKAYGAEITILPVNNEGLVDPRDVAAAIKENTALVSVMYGNNEVGSVQPIIEISQVVREANEERQKTKNNLKIIFHTDAVQAFQYFDTDVQDLGVDMLSLTAHKFYGPKGAGLLYVKSGTKFKPQQLGGAQERGQRAGTENVPYIVGMTKAMQISYENREKRKRDVKELRDYLEKRILSEIPDVEPLGSKDSERRLPHIAAFLFKRIEGEAILINLDLLGIAASSGSACTSGSLEPSHVTKAIGFSDMDAHGAVRFSLGKMNTKVDIDELMKHLPGIVEKLRAMSPIK